MLFEQTMMESITHEFINFYETREIKSQFTITYMPQQNGVWKRKNRTIMDMMRILFTGSGLLKNHWSKVVNWCIHILNRSLMVVVRDKTSEEAWSG
jgi:hypothetical protein